MEQRRILNFAGAAGIVDYQEDDAVPLILRKEQLVLVTVFSQIESKLADLADFTDKYDQLNYTRLQSSQVSTEQRDVQEKFASLVSWEKHAERRASNKAKANHHRKGTNHFFKAVHVVGDVIKDPKRLIWTAIDEKAFQSILSDVSDYNFFLEQLLHGEYARKLEERTQKTYLEVVNVRDSVDDLKRLMHDMFDVLENGANVAHDENSKPSAGHRLRPLAVLAETKLRSVLNDAEHKPPAYHEVIKPTKVAFRLLESISELPSEVEESVHRKRATAKLKLDPDDGSPIDVFIEWKTYSTVQEKGTDRLVPNQSSLDRANGLVSLLQSSNLEAFRTPMCEGYFDLRDDETTTSQPPVFGILYRSPVSEKAPSTPISLLSRLGTSPKPSLGARMKLAHAISDSVLYFNTVRWFHKSLRSDAVIFFEDSNKKMDIAQPYLSGFEYARPSSSGLTTHVTQHPANSLYVHPAYQGSTGPGYARTFDIYSLGIVLLEIAYWDTIQSILSEEFANPKTGPTTLEAQGVRDILLGLKPGKHEYIADLKGMTGDRYHAAVEGCIRGFIESKEDENEVGVSMKLQEGFTRDVVDNLKTLLDI